MENNTKIEVYQQNSIHMLKNISIIFGLSGLFLLTPVTRATTLKHKQQLSKALYAQSDIHIRAIESRRYWEIERRNREREQQVRQLALELTNKRDYVGLGNLFYSNGYMPDAISAYTTAIEANPKNSTIYFLRGRVKGDQDDLQGEIADDDTAISLNPASDGAYVNRAVAKYKLKDKNGSLQDFRSAARIYRATGNTVDLEDTMRRIRSLFKVQE
jgi:tetratricopeptide (TPR) repeat protein